jgi:hypothetical protein
VPGGEGDFDRGGGVDERVAQRGPGGDQQQRVVFLLALDGFPHRPDGDPRDDLDLASPGIVKVLDNRHGDTHADLPWEPKAAFTTLAEYYRAA